MNCRICESRRLKIVTKSKNYRILECKTCRIAFTDPAPNLPDYQNMDFHSKESDSNIDKLVLIEDLPYDWRILIKMQIDLVLTQFVKDASILEIGCGEGILLGQLRKYGFSALEGFEPSYTAAKRAQKRGLSIHNAYFDPLIINRKYDLVVMSHVLEHIENPIEFLEQINSILNPGGGLLLTQTNYRGLIPKIQKDSWYAWVPDQHFWHFTPKSLETIFNRTGYLISSVNYSSLVHPSDILYKAAKLITSYQDQFILFAKKNY